MEQIDKDRFITSKREAINQLSESTINHFQKVLKPTFFKPLTVADVENIEVSLWNCQSKEDNETCYALTVMQSVFDKVNKGCGCRISVIVKNKDTLLGVIKLTSAGRPSKAINNFIGWNDAVKWGRGNGGLQRLGYAHTIIPFQPFGFNCLGGKLLAMISTSKEITDLWFNKYQKPLHGIVTLSMTGGLTQYNGLRNYKKLETVSSSKTKESRGIYFCKLYDNTVALLNESETIPKGDRRLTIPQIVDEWKPKAIKRMQTIINESRLKTDIDTYDSLFIPKGNKFFN